MIAPLQFFFFRCRRKLRSPVTHARLGTPALSPYVLKFRCIGYSVVLLWSDEPVDPKPALEKLCHEPCKPLWEDYKACGTRIAKKGDGECSAWYFDYWKCVDKCVAPKLFEKLK